MKLLIQRMKLYYFYIVKVKLNYNLVPAIDHTMFFQTLSQNEIWLFMNPTDECNS